MRRFSLFHWGLYEVGEDGAGAPRLMPYSSDPDPSPIGLHQLSPELEAVRVRRPAVRASWLEKGPGAATEKRGREDFVEVEWDEALDLVAGEIGRVREAFGNSAIFGGSYGWGSAGRFHHAQSQVHRFLNSVGGYVRHRDSYSLGAAHVIMKHVVDEMQNLISYHHSWDVLAKHTELFVTFGGVPWKNAQSAVGGVGLHRVKTGLDAMRRAGTQFVNIGPVAENIDTGGAVEWVQARPGSDTALMLAIAFVLQDEGLLDRGFLASHCVGYPVFERYLTGEADGVAKTPDWGEAITGVPAATIADLARRMARSRTMVNVAWSLQRAHHGEQPFWMVVVLAAMLGQIGLPGGGFGVGYGALNTMGTPHERLGGPRFEQGQNAVSQFIPVARIADLLLNPNGSFTYDGATHVYPDIRLVYWAGGNPFHHHQDLNRLREAWRKPETIVVNDHSWSAAARHADIVLPATTSVERDDLGYASQEGFLSWMSKLAEPVGEARDDYEIFGELARRLGAEEAFTEGRSSAEWLRHMYATNRARYETAGIALPDFENFHEIGLVELEDRAKPVVMLEAFREDPVANALSTPSGRIEIFSERIASFGIPDCPGHPTWLPPDEWLGAPLTERFPLHLLSDQPRNRLHSQLDASPLSAGGKVAGREPVHISPEDAKARGIRTGDVVEIFNDRGRCLAGAVVTEGMMKGVVRLATGAWYDPDEETGLERHGNPNVLTKDIPTSGLSQGCAAQSCLVEMSGPVAAPPPVDAFAPPRFVVRPENAG